MSETPYRYTAEMAGRIETGWQDRWQEQGTFRAPNPAGPWAEPERVREHDGHMLILDMFPYPSGAGLHVGHPLGYIATDVYARYQRMLGKNVLHCLGYDAFGLPAEQFAVQTGQHPRTTTEANMVVMKRQLRRLGLGHDDRRAFATIDPDYYKWTQWIFLQIHNAWYDEEALRPDGGRGRARPIDELIEEFASGSRPLPKGETRAWSQLSGPQRAEVLDDYRLAYTSHAPVNWAPGLGTVLANEEVTGDGRSERGNYPVFKANLRQWMMRITSYADRLADDLDRVDWPHKVKAMQRNWIGRSEGASVTFTARAADGGEHGIEVFTTRPDTLFGASFMVLAPEHPLVDVLVPRGGWPEGTRDAWTAGAATPAEAVAAYRDAAGRKSEVERQIETKDKTGVFTGGWAINPADGEPVPVFVADYVLMGYGTGAIMAVPSGDQRDFEYASAFGLPIVPTVQAPEGHEGAWGGDGEIINSANESISLNGMSVAEGKAAITAWLEEQGLGRGTVNYKLRDWLFSRQRYWGEPFPIVFDEEGTAHALPESMLPVELPEVEHYSPRTFDPDDASSEPEPPLGRATEWVEVELDLGDGPQKYRRETNTMPNWAGSCWYYLRYLDPANDSALVDPDNEAYWVGPREETVPGAPPGSRDPGGVDLYIGGVEHAVLHLLYARFWHKVLYDLGHVSSEEPFRKYFSQGYIQAHAYRDDRGQPVPASEVEEHVDEHGLTTFDWQGQAVTQEYGKIGKSLKNAVSPDEMYEQFGADTFRVYEMSLGPLDQSKPWETRAVVGSQRFLQRLWRNVIDEGTGEVHVTEDALDPDTERLLHRTIAAVSEDYGSLGFNTAISRLIELNNALTKRGVVPRAAAEPLVLMVAPVAPHLAEELWSRLGHEESLSQAPFPVADESKMVDSSVTCVIQVKGKVRDRLEVPADISEEDLRELALGRDKVKALTEGGIRTVIVRAPKLVNVVPA
ncbi:leucine--tRNA ligase [Janibacter sp. GS2]|uniref:leucine--tRNA ligase n=1 Tax=Janibacter sp. GS2 TaxID=3442646 RepID=UPI003EBB8710